MDGAEHEVLAYMDFPKAHWLQIHSTNRLGRQNAEIKRRTNVVGIFPNDRAVTRLVGAILLEQNDEWTLQRRYMQLEGLQSLSDTPRLACRLCSAELRVHLGPSGLWTYTTRWDTILADPPPAAAPSSRPRSMTVKEPHRSRFNSDRDNGRHPRRFILP